MLLSELLSTHRESVAVTFERLSGGKVVASFAVAFRTSAQTTDLQNSKGEQVPKLPHHQELGLIKYAVYENLTR